MLQESLAAKISRLEQRLEKQEKNEATVDYAISTARQVCSKQEKDLDFDAIHQALLELDAVARRTNHPKSGFYGSVLTRFSIRRHDKGAKEQVAFFVYRLLSTPEEARILELEQKYLKQRSSAKGEGSKEGDKKAEEPDSVAYQPRGRGRGRGRGAFGRGRGSGGRCWSCGQTGHWQNACPFLYGSQNMQSHFTPATSAAHSAPYDQAHSNPAPVKFE